MNDYLQDDDTTQGKKFTLQDLIDMSAELFAQEEDKPHIIYIPKVIARTMKPKQLCYNCKHFECIEKQNGAFCRCVRDNDPNVGAWRCKYYQHINDNKDEHQRQC